MDAIEALFTRRAVREFTSEPVSEEQIDTVLRAAMHAPSACNQQPWHFIVVTSRDGLDAIAGVHPYAQMLKQAPLAVIVCADLTIETCPGNWAIDCSAAMENLLLAVHALGLGGVWVGIHPVADRVKDFRQLLGLPDYTMPLCLAAVGHPAAPLPKLTATTRSGSIEMPGNSVKLLIKGMPRSFRLPPNVPFFAFSQTHAGRAATLSKCPSFALR